jgi:hypothetical protein
MSIPRRWHSSAGASLQCFLGSQSVSQLTAQSINVCLPLLAVSKYMSVPRKSALSPPAVRAGTRHHSLLGAYTTDSQAPWMGPHNGSELCRTGPRCAAAAGFLDLGTLIALVLVAGAFTAIRCRNPGVCATSSPKTILPSRTPHPGFASFPSGHRSDGWRSPGGDSHPWQTSRSGRRVWRCSLVAPADQANEEPVRPPGPPACSGTCPWAFVPWSSSAQLPVRVDYLVQYLRAALITTFLTYSVRSLGIPGTVGIMIGTGAFAQSSASVPGVAWHSPEAQEA